MVESGNKNNIINNPKHPLTKMLVYNLDEVSRIKGSNKNLRIPKLLPLEVNYFEDNVYTQLKTKDHLILAKTISKNSKKDKFDLNEDFSKSEFNAEEFN